MGPTKTCSPLIGYIAPDGLTPMATPGDRCPMGDSKMERKAEGIVETVLKKLRRADAR